MTRHVHARPPVLITTAPESPNAEFGRRSRRYAIMSAVFVGCFAAGAIEHRHTAAALSLCVVAMITLVVAVFAANTRSRPRRTRSLARRAHRVHRVRGELTTGPRERNN